MFSVLACCGLVTCLDSGGLSVHNVTPGSVYVWSVFTCCSLVKCLYVVCLLMLQIHQLSSCILSAHTQLSEATVCGLYAHMQLREVTVCGLSALTTT